MNGPSAVNRPKPEEKGIRFVLATVASIWGPGLMVFGFWLWIFLSILSGYDGSGAGALSQNENTLRSWIAFALSLLLILTGSGLTCSALWFWKQRWFPEKETDKNAIFDNVNTQKLRKTAPAECRNCNRVSSVLGPDGQCVHCGKER